MDHAIMELVQSSLHNPFTDAVFPVITNLGEWGAIWILAAFFCLASRKYRKCGFFMLLAMLMGVILGEFLMKNTICRPRPFVDFPNVPLLVPEPSGFSFPSGHATSSFAAATVLWRRDKRVGRVAYGLAVLIAFSRIFLFVHYPLDALAGSILGYLCGDLVYSIYERKRFVKVFDESDLKM